MYSIYTYIVCTYIYMHVHTYVYMHIYTHIHTQTNEEMERWGQESLQSLVPLETGINIFSHVNPMADKIPRAVNNRVLGASSSMAPLDVCHAKDFLFDLSWLRQVVKSKRIGENGVIRKSHNLLCESLRNEPRDSDYFLFLTKPVCWLGRTQPGMFKPRRRPLLSATTRTMLTPPLQTRLFCLGVHSLPPLRSSSGLCSKALSPLCWRRI